MKKINVGIIGRNFGYNVIFKAIKNDKSFNIIGFSVKGLPMLYFLLFASIRINPLFLINVFKKLTKYIVMLPLKNYFQNLIALNYKKVFFYHFHLKDYKEVKYFYNSYHSHLKNYAYLKLNYTYQM